MLRPSANKNSTDAYIQVSTETMGSRYPVSFSRQVSVLLKRAVLCTIRDLVCHSKNIHVYLIVAGSCQTDITIRSIYRFEVFTAVTMNNGVFWDVMPCGSCKNRRFGGT
jgi:hypothetical protein